MIPKKIRYYRKKMIQKLIQTAFFKTAYFVIMKLFSFVRRNSLTSLCRKNAKNCLYILFFAKLNLWIFYYLQFCLQCQRSNVFFYQSYYHLGEGRRSVTHKVTTLFIASPYLELSKLNCAQKHKNGTITQATKKRFIHSTSMGLCKFDMFILQCKFKKYTPNEPFQIVHGKSEIAKITPKKSDTKKRNFVVCMSRVMAFEQWQLMITVLEIYRYMKVDLVVTSVQSTLAVVFKLMKIYEKQGLLAVRPGIRFPFYRGMPWDPNEQTEYSAQIVLAHDCFYEFRESAKFMALLDWDDLLSVSPKFTSFYEAFHQTMKLNPSAAYFLVNKLHCNFTEQNDARWGKNTLARLFSQSGICSAVYEGQKMVVRPKRLYSFWIHYSNFVMHGKTEKLLPTNHSMLVHLANSFEIRSEEYQFPILSELLNFTNIVRNFELNIERDANWPMLSRELPRKKLYLDAFDRCHSQLVSYYKTLNPRLCLNYKLCHMPKLNVECVNTKNKFESKCVTTAGGFSRQRFFVHTRLSTGFQHSNHGCQSA